MTHEIESRGKVHSIERALFDCVHYRVPASEDGCYDPRPLCGYGSHHLRWTENASLVVCDACKEALEIIARFSPKPGTRITVPVPEYYANLRKTILRLVELYGPSRDGTKISNNPYPYTRVETAYRYLLENTELNKTLRVESSEIGWDWVI